MRSTILAAALSILPLSSLAGPDETSKYLMNNSPTLLDFGLVRLDMRLSSALGNVAVIYDWDNDAIKIVRAGGGDYSKDMCLNFIDEVRSNAGYQEGTLWSILGNSLFSELFAHMGYFSGDEDKHLDRLEEIDKKFQIDCYSSETNARYSAKLAGKEVSVTALD